MKDDIKPIVELIINSAPLTTADVINILNVDANQITCAVTSYNQISFYKQIIIVDDYIEVKNKADDDISHLARQNLIQQMVLANTHSISELEIIFGRSDKTIYREIKRAKDAIRDHYLQFKEGDIKFVIYYVNSLDASFKQYLAKVKQTALEKLIRNTVDTINRICAIDCDADLLVNMYLGEAQISAGDKQFCIRLAEEIVDNIQKYLHMQFVNYNKIKLLEVHLETKLFAYRHNLLLKTIDYQLIVHKYMAMYKRVAPIIKMILNVHELAYSEEEVMYIALYFLNEADYRKNTVRVIAKRGSDKIMIENQLREHFENFELSENEANIIISNEKHNAQTICVNTLFGLEDLKVIAKYIDKQKNVNEQLEMYFKLKPLLKKSVEYEDFQRCVAPLQYEENSSILSIAKDDIFWMDTSIKWLQAIRMICRQMIANHSTDESYYLEIMKYIERYKSEFLIAKEVALIHAPITSHVYKTDIVILYNKSGFLFPNEQSVKLVIGFCAITEIDMLLPLQDLYQIITNPSFNINLGQVENKHQLCQLLSNSQK